jgi:hypothetical protein
VFERKHLLSNRYYFNIKKSEERRMMTGWTNKRDRKEMQKNR